MVRKYKRKLGSRNYKDYSEEQLAAALAEVKAGKSLRKTALAHNIPFCTLSRKLRGLHNKEVGHPTILTKEEEEAIIEGIITMAEWGFPVDTRSLKIIVRDYMREIKQDMNIFKNKLPGKDYVYGFLKRHSKILSQRLVPNYSRKRASVTVDVLNQYFDNVERTLSDVPDDNKLNFDESNLNDDPGKKICFVKKGVKYPYQVKDFTKSNISLMISGTAAGELLPPFVCYKAKGLFNTWRNGGPKGARYTSSKSGWFESATFEEWFFTIALPFLRKKEGKKAVIGDNLSSHFSLKVLNACKANQIKFICLPPNATDYLQPLDVTFFGPLKRKWREILDAYKNDYPNVSAVKKDLFPQLLKKLWDDIEPTASANLISGFQTCLSREKILSSRRFEVLPYSQVQTTISKVLVDVLKAKRFGDKPKMLRRQRAAVDAGKSLTNETSEEESDENSSESLSDEDIEPTPEKEKSSTEDEAEESSEESSEESLPENENEVAEEDEPSEEEDNGAVADIIENDENNNTETSLMIPEDFEDVTSGKWIIAYRQ